ncbi:hypothetical protein OHC33_008561 [Knufia fluminis]|uniref:GP-PDE domain-containing protein n=1 Tax=Knufia fluminis TaxID=191047 RepID=A0AAN8I1Z6_9EURO|nr:hypothetical protein OHC33_008561 [Knufia fluminis]
MANDKDHLKPLLQAERGHGEKNVSYSSTAMARPNAQDPFPLPTFTQARTVGKRKLPQAIAHRGYKAEYPENTMCAFKAALEKGRAHAIETDIHLTKDNVVVLSHDPDLKRCFGRTERIIDCDWAFLSQLRTTKAPYEPMPRLRDLLEYISQPSLQDVWILLDIKLDNDSENVMRLIADTLASVDPGRNPWQNRVVLGIWAAKYLSLCVKYLPNFPVAYIGFSTFYARQFLKVPHVGFNIFQKTLLGPIGSRFIRDVQKQNRPLYVWTVNEANMMKWSIKKSVDGVITDDPKLFNEVCDEYDDERVTVQITWSQWLYSFWLFILVALFSIPLKHRLPGSADTFLANQKLKERASLMLGA